MRTELFMLAVWSAVTLQGGVLPTSYIISGKDMSVQAYMTKKQAKDMFLPFFPEQDVTEDQTRLFISVQEEAEETESDTDRAETEEVSAELEETTVDTTGSETVSKEDKTAVPATETESETAEASAASEATTVDTTGSETVSREDKTAVPATETEPETEESSAASEVTTVDTAGSETVSKEDKTAAPATETEPETEEVKGNTAVAEAVGKEDKTADSQAEKRPDASEETEENTADTETVAKDDKTTASKTDTESEEPSFVAEETVQTELQKVELNTDPNTLTFLVNKEYALPADYVPKLVEPKVNHCQPAGSHKRYMRAEAAAALEEMFAAAKKDGYDLWVKTAYRSYQNQYSTYTWMLANRGVQEAVYYHAVPGTSEHQTGLAVDIVCKDSGYENDLSFEKTKEYKWLKENCYKYGFTLRYLKGMEHITGYNYEPWHYRYVGVELAAYLMENGLTLEEYYQALPTTDLFRVPEEFQHLIRKNTESK